MKTKVARHVPRNYLTHLSLLTLGTQMTHMAHSPITNNLLVSPLYLPYLASGPKFHFHIVPRWVGDTNFMPAIGQTKVMVGGLTETYDELKSNFDKLK